MRVSVCRISCALATLAVVFSVTGCGLKSSAAPASARKSATGGRAKPGGHSPTGRLAQSPVNATVYAPAVSRHAPALTDLASVSTTGLVRVKGVPYVERLPGPGWTLVYAVIPQGILWTLAAPPPSRGATGARQQQSLATVYLTPLASPAPFVGGAHPRPAPLAIGHSLVSAAPPPHATAILHTSLTAGSSSALYSGEWAIPGGRTVFSLYFLPYGGSPAMLLQRKLDALQAVEAWPTAHGAVVAQASETAYGWHVDSALMLNPSKAGQPTPLPASQWPLTVSAKGRSVAFQSGAQVSLIGPSGQVDTGWAAPNPHVLALLRAQLPGSTLLLPGAFSDSLTGAWRLTSGRRGTYRLSLATSPQGSQQLTALVTQAAGATRGGGRAQGGGTPSGHGQNASVPAVPLYFGARRTEHAFQLSSERNVTVQWLYTTRALHPGPPEWFASFHTGVWTYEIGPFTSPANRGQTESLSYLIGRALAQNPTPLAASGAADIKIAGTAGDVVSSQLRFTTTGGLHVRLDGPGMEPLNTAADWTLWSPPKRPSR